MRPSGRYVARTNAAVTWRCWSIGTWQGPVQVQAPAAQAKIGDASGVAARLTDASRGKAASQVLPQLIPAGVETTVPAPFPCLETVRVTVRGAKVAVTERAVFIVVWQVPMPEQSPDQPANTDDGLAVAVRVTAVPEAKFA